MSISYNESVSPDEINYNNISLDRVIYNGVTVWEKYSEITVLDFSATPDIPSGISTAYPSPNEQAAITLYKSCGWGDRATISDEINIGLYEMGYASSIIDGNGEVIISRYQPVDENPNSGFNHGGNNSWRKKTEIDVTKYNTCIVDEACMYGITGDSSFYFCPIGTTGNHQYGMFTMMNDSELYDLCQNWRKLDDWYYWWESDSLFPNNHREGSGYNDDKHIPNEHFNRTINRPDDPYVETINEVSGGIKPGTYWSEVDWNHKLGFAFHNWLLTGPYDEEHQRGSANSYGSLGPIVFFDDWNAGDGGVYGIEKFRTSKQWMESYGYEQNVKFSVQGLTGNRVIRCLLLPFSCTGTHSGDLSYRGSYITGRKQGGVRIFKITLNTNKLPADRPIYRS